jgi:alpha-amylase/alpha-mannosidase (GH57 family)
MTPIKLCLLWHQHQPYYRAGNRFLMPWAWLHSTKDYLEMAQHLERYPGMHATINLVPSLLKQIEEYLAGGASDRALDLMTKNAETLWSGDQLFMLDNFFIAHRERVIDRSPRYRELYEKAYFRGPDRQSQFDTQDYRDLAVQYSLAWTGEISRVREPFKSLVDKDRGYTEADKQALMLAQIENVRKIIPLHRDLSESGQIELTTTPFYHPILPLLVDSMSARDAMPNVSLPSAPFNSPEEADGQLRLGRDYFKETFGNETQGLWPSEGSLSEEVLTLIRRNGFLWTASDEAVLMNSVRGQPVNVGSMSIKPEHAKYFPWIAKTPDGELVVFFRNHRLSDDIGFTYQTWNAREAAQNFIENILKIRTDLIEAYGQEILEDACISVILDGENCWEFYPNNGFEFLDTLYSMLTSTPEINPVTFSNAIATSRRENLPKLPHLLAGSWINANFSIWIGHPENNAAWNALAQAKSTFDNAKNRVELMSKGRSERLAQIESAHEELMIAEGSDWWWWYDEEHFSTQKDTFDELFRMHLRAMYVKLDLTVPANLSQPIAGQGKGDGTLHKYGAMQPAAGHA